MHDPKGPGVIFVQALSLVAQLGFGTQGFREKLIPFIEDIGEADIRRDAAGFSEVFGKFFEKDDPYFNINFRNDVPDMRINPNRII